MGAHYQHLLLNFYSCQVHLLIEQLHLPYHEVYCIVHASTMLFVCVACCVRGCAGPCKALPHLQVVRRGLIRGTRLVEPRHRSLSDMHSRCKEMDAILSAIWYSIHTLFFTTAEDDDEGVGPIYPLTVFFALGIWFVSRGISILGTGLYLSAFLSQRCVPILSLSCQLHPNADPQAASPLWTSVTLQNPTLDAHLGDSGLPLVLPPRMCPNILCSQASQSPVTAAEVTSPSPKRGSS